MGERCRLDAVPSKRFAVGARGVREASDANGAVGRSRPAFVEESGLGSGRAATDDCGASAESVDGVGEFHDGLRAGCGAVQLEPEVSGVGAMGVQVDPAGAVIVAHGVFAADLEVCSTKGLPNRAVKVAGVFGRGRVHGGEHVGKDSRERAA